MTRDEVVNCLLDCEDRAYGYHLNEKVLGFPVGQFENVMHAAAAMLKAEEKRGRWVIVHGYFTPGGDPVWACSECGKGMHVYGIEHGSYGADIADGQWVACPNCGTKMDDGYDAR